MHPVRDSEEEEVLVETPDDVHRLLDLSNHTKCYRIRLAQRLFGPPQWTLHWSHRRVLFQQLGKFDNLTTLIVHGTIMGQVIPGHALALSMSAPNLRVLRVEAGLILDSVTDVLEMAAAVLNHKHLVEFSLLQFLNHVIPVDSMFLMDPLLGALSTIPTLETIELRCLSSFMHWETSFVSSWSIKRLLTSSRALKRLELTNLGLGDEQMETISTTATSPLHELIVNANNNTKRGLTALLHRVQPCWTELQVANSIKLSKEQYAILHSHLACFDNQLQDFCCTYPIGLEEHQRRVNLQLSLHRMNLNQRYYSPNATPEQRVQVLAELTTGQTQLDHIYTLLREQPTICDLGMNGIKVHTLQFWWERWVLLVLLIIWTQYLMLGGTDASATIGLNEVAQSVERSPDNNLVADASTMRHNDLATSSGLSSLESARAKKHQMRSKLKQQMASIFGSSTIHQEKCNTEATSALVNIRQRRLHIQAQREVLQYALDDFCRSDCKSKWSDIEFRER
jgi:hypothetical protein